jgi:ubiquinone/menaquinone biosynthesis C-methylase UbiE
MGKGVFEHLYNSGAGGYDQNFGHISAQFIPTLLRAGRIGPGQRVLDIATGTGIAAALAAETVGPAGHVTAADISPAMLEQARKRLEDRTNVSFALEDGQNLTFPTGDFDAVLCSLGLMLFPDPARGLAEFYRVLRRAGYAAISVNTSPDRSFWTRVNAAIGQHVPSRAAAGAQYFSLGSEDRLRALFGAAGFQNVEVTTETRRYGFSSFGAYFAPIEQARGPTGQEYVALPDEVRRAVREDLRRSLEGDGERGGPIEIEMEIMFASGIRNAAVAPGKENT